jgi:hypothetical protein
VTATGVPPTISFTISCQIRTLSGYARASSWMTSEMTGSIPPMRVAHPEGAPSFSRSKRGLSIDRIPSLGGPPDLISFNGTVCCEKSVRGHSARQLLGSAAALLTIVMAAATSAAAITVKRTQFALNVSPLRVLILPQRLRSRPASVSISTVRLMDQNGYRRAG